MQNSHQTFCIQNKNKNKTRQRHRLEVESITISQEKLGTIFFFHLNYVFSFLQLVGLGLLTVLKKAKMQEIIKSPSIKGGRQIFLLKEGTAKFSGLYMRAPSSQKLEGSGDLEGRSRKLLFLQISDSLPRTSKCFSFFGTLLVII